MQLRNATVLVTGGSSGIGQAVAHTLVESGARVAITGRHRDRLQAAAQSLGAHAIEADVSNEADVRRTMKEVLATFGHLDVLVNNAGFGVFKPLVDLSREELEAVFATNVTGAMVMAREAARHFVERGHGNIVNIASTAGLRGGPNGTAYYASKFALRGMTECWRAELRPHNVRVFLVNPSEVLTNFGAAAQLAGSGVAAPAGRQEDADPTKLHAEDIAHMVKAALEMHDRGFTPELTVFATNPSS